jgi:uncharacterized membrane protein YkoI
MMNALTAETSREVNKIEMISVKRKNIATLCLVLCASAFSVIQAAPTEAELTAQAKVKEREAKKIALQQVPTGSIKSVEIENEKGHLVWSFDISKPGTRNTTEVLVDAKTGKIVSVSKENPAEQAAEEKADKLQH